LFTGNYYQLPTGRVAALDADTPFPPIEYALAEPNGLIAIGGDLSSQRILAAYQQGIFPWFNPDEPILWWSPNPRMVLKPLEFKISKNFKKTFVISGNHEYYNKTKTIQETNEFMKEYFKKYG